MNARKFHLFDLPNKTCILLDGKFRLNLFTLIIGKIGSVKKFAKEINRNYRTVYSWINNKAGKSEAFIPLNIVKNMLYPLPKGKWN